MNRILVARNAAGAIAPEKIEKGGNYGAVRETELAADGGIAGSTDQDARDMWKLGVQQETKRRFGLVTILAFTTTMMCTWESAIPFFTTAFLNGSGVSMIYGYIVAFLGSLATCASMAEMASM